MNISDILANLMGNKMSNVVRTEDGVTYGPAMTRISRTPISFGSLPEKRQGEFYPDTNSIKVDPTKGNVNQVTRHEQVHALLNKFREAGAPQTTSAPNFMDIARVLQPQVAGDMENEVPAYMGQSKTSGFYGISDQQRNDYMNGLVGQLQKLDPNIAAKMQKLSQGN